MHQLIIDEILAPGVQRGLFRQLDPGAMAGLLMTLYLGIGSVVDEEGRSRLAPSIDRRDLVGWGARGSRLGLEEGRMQTLWLIPKIMLGLIGVVLFSVFLFVLPATLSLPRGRRPGLEDLTIEEATVRLRRSGAEGWDLVEKARLLVGDRMAYCRRNGFDSYKEAFQRGYGYCEQSAFALAELLQQIGFDARPVHSERNRFPDRDSPTGHAWVRVLHGGETRDIDPRHQDPATGEFLFEPGDDVREYSLAFRIMARWTCPIVNAYRYYRTGSDVESGY